MDLPEDNQQLITDIEDLVSDIQTIKNQIYNLYESDRPQLLLRDIPRDLNEYDGPRTQLNRFVNLRCQELSVYEMIMKIRTDKTRSVISVSIPVPNSNCYGLQFDLNHETGTYSLVRCFLPYSLKASEEKEKAKNMEIHGIKKYLGQVQMNIYAYSMRKEQLDEFKDAYDKERICFDYSLGCTHVCLRFVVTILETETKHRVDLKCVYLLDQILPSELIQEIRPKISPNLKENLLRCFEHFKRNTFRQAYAQSFVDTELFQFF